LISCEKGDNNENPQVIDQRYEITPWQNLSPTGSIASLVIKSLEAEPCTNSVLEATDNFDDENFNIVIKGNNHEGTCNEGESYPELNLWVPVDDLKRNLLVEELDGEKLEAKIVFEDNTIKIYEASSTKDFVLSDEQLILIDDNIYWGYLEGEVDKINEAISLIESQVYLGSLGPPDPVEGNYGHFKYADKVVTLPEQPENAAGFVYPYDQIFSWSDIKKAFETMEQSYPDIKYYLVNHDGQETSNY